MPEVTYQCEFAECAWETKTSTVSDYVALYRIHVKARHPDTGTASDQVGTLASKFTSSHDLYPVCIPHC